MIGFKLSLGKGCHAHIYCRSICKTLDQRNTGVLSLTFDLLSYLLLTFGFLDFLPTLVLDLKSCINAGEIIIFGCVMLPCSGVGSCNKLH